MNSGASELDRRLVDYAEKIGKLVERLPATRTGNHAAGQLLRAGTSPLPALGASEAAGSKEELISDLRACLRSLEESRRWLRFIRHVPLIHPVGETDPLLTETESLIRIFAARLWAERSKSALRWQLRRPRRVPRKTGANKVWHLAKAACRHVWPG